jgi:hypothetical protein
MRKFTEVQSFRLNKTIRVKQFPIIPSTPMTRHTSACQSWILSNCRVSVSTVNIYEIILYLRHTFMTSSIVSAIIIGCERSFAVRSPLKYREKWTKQFTIKLYLVMYIIFLSFVMTRAIVSNIISVEYYKEHLYLPYFIIVATTRAWRRPNIIRFGTIKIR